MYMEQFFLYVLPALLVLGVFFLGRIRVWVEGCATQVEHQAPLIESFQDNAAKFIRLSDAENHAELRFIVQKMGYWMVDGSKLIETFLASGTSLSEPRVNDGSEEVRVKIESLPEEAQHALAKALGIALVVSSCQSFRWGRHYRRMLYWVLSGPEKEVKEPVQVVYRFQKASSLSSKNKKLCTT